MTAVEFQNSWQKVSTALTTAAKLLATDCQVEIAKMINSLETENLSAKESIEVLIQWFKWENDMCKKLDAIDSRNEELGENLEAFIDETKQQQQQLNDSVNNINDEMKNLDTKLNKTAESVEKLGPFIDETMQKQQQQLKIMDTKLNKTIDDLSDIESTMKQKEIKLMKEQVDQRELNREIEVAKLQIKDHTDTLEEYGLPQETRQTRSCLKKLKENNIIILTGIPGSGKTFLAFSILKQILDNEPSVDPLIMSTPNEFKKVLDTSRQLILLVDDILGKFRVDGTELKQWNRYVDKLLAFIKTHNLLVIITIRTNIMAACEHESIRDIFKPEYIYDLEENQLTKQEKEEMFILFANQFGIEINTEQVETAVSLQNFGIGFPFLCKVMKGNDIPALFSNPASYLKKALLAMRKESFFVALLMTLFCENKLCQTGLNKHQNRCFKEISSYFKSSSIDKATMFDAANSLVNTYLMFNATGLYFCFIHDAVAEATFFAAKECILDILIDLCPIKTLTRFFMSEQKTDKNSKKMCLPFEKLADRFKDELSSDESKIAIQCIGCSSLWHNQTFWETAFQILDPKDFYREDADHLSLLSYLSINGHIDLIENILDFEFDPREIREKQIYLSTKESCKVGKEKSFSVLIRKIKKITYELMFAAVQGRNLHIFETLLQKGGNIESVKPETNENLLHEACENADHNTVAAILRICRKTKPLKSLLLQTTVQGLTPLLYAARRGNVEVFKILLEDGSEIDATDNDGFNSLHYAAMYGRIDLVKYLTVKRSELKYKVSKKGHTIAHSATAGTVECLEYIIEQGVDINNVTTDGGTLLHEASANGNVQMVKYICNKHRAMVGILDRDGETPCHYAARGGHVNCLEILFEQKIDPAIKSNKGYTLLHEAAFWGKHNVIVDLCSKYPDMVTMLDANGASAAHHAAAGGHLDCLEYLITSKIEPLLKTHTGFTLLHEASYTGHVAIVKFLCKKYKGMIESKAVNEGNAAFSAVCGGHVDCLKYLVQKGIDIEQTKANNETLLHTACYFGQVEIVKYLCESFKQIVEATDDKSRTAAQFAAKRGNLECLKILETSICTGNTILNTIDKDGTSLLHVASQHGHNSMVEYLCEHSRSLIDIINKKGLFPIYFAARGGHLDCVKIMLKHGMHPDKRSGARKVNILHTASEFGHANVVSYLCKNYDFLMKEGDSKGKTAAFLVAEKNKLECLKTLIDHGTAPLSRGYGDKTLGHIAVEYGHTDIVKYLIQTDPRLIHSKDKAGRTLTYVAAGFGHLECLQLLIDCGADPLGRCMGGETILHQAVRRGHLKVALYICEYHPSLKNSVAKKGRTAAMAAASGGALECLKLLLERGCNPYSKCKLGDTILHVATKKGNLDVVKHVCIEYQDLISTTNEKGQTAVNIAIYEGHLECFKYLTQHNFDPFDKKTRKNYLHFAALKGQLNIVKYLCEFHSELMQMEDIYGYNAVHEAVIGGHLECLKYLLEQGSDLVTISHNGKTPLHAAAERGKTCIVEYLSQFEDLLDYKDKYGHDLAYFAVVNGHLECLKLLLDKGTDPMNLTKRNWTILHVASYKGNADIVRYLCETQLHLTKKYLNDAIRLAVYNHHECCIDILNDFAMAQT